MATHTIDGLKVVTSNIFPPIPDRKFDWCAYFDGEEDGWVGYGPTEEDAIDDLMCVSESDRAGPAEREEHDHLVWKWDHDRDARKHS
ncbi:MAG TPA: hypothetical protein VLC51_07275 [Nitrospira sp.]|nr:hypothetical protein [Nitrospira sp.]